MTRAKVLFIDDQRAARDLFERLIDSSRFEALVADGVVSGEAVIAAQRPEVVVTDLRMPEVDGLEGLARFQLIDPELPVVLVTAFGSIETAVEAMRRGAFDYVRKPFAPSELHMVIERAIRHRELLRENSRLRSEVRQRYAGDDIVCRCPAMGSVMALASRVAATDLSVLILGESGTGKDLFARRLHHLSHRANKRFVSINCSAIPEHLLESELFGHEKGAFSGATSSKQGFFAEADGGTLFLDEIGDMSANLQPKLLRVLQDGEFYPVGSRHLLKSDVRLVCASNQRIQEMVREGRFRQDLYYRINTVELVLPPLRERPEDVALLAEHFLAQLEKRGQRVPAGFSATALRCLLDYGWPGNVRELEHVVDRAALICDSERIEMVDLPTELRVAAGAAAAGPGMDGGGHADRDVEFKAARSLFERAYFERLLGRTGGSVQQAATLAGIHRTTLYEKLARLGIEHGG